ncbi:class II aldolase and Adducin N-terminal domain-containing protein [Staphylotrichum tortipilum]|uniref:Class II aldolase and Adducin N-terminal domain-containing protein n=1 Tax=Staphylotrichum tortipilum TaxID=2831512 RepID=A0AAN6RQG3_9PEZI|nr:class II aldolase and Adducin N-terminal domain-containing protein [Staphylotrichum longicolle]
MISANITSLLATYIDALHILHHHGVLDGYGHLSVRHPDNPPTFFMMRQVAPALVSGLDDIGEYRVSDAEPVHPDTPAAPIERFIHSELLKRYSDVNVVLHGHPNELIACSIAPEARLKPVIHMAPFLGSNVPIFDIAALYQPSDTQDFLVRNQRLGAALAAEFGGSSDSPYPPHNLVLMASHGFAAVARDIKLATYMGVYAVANARVQSQALQLQQVAGMGHAPRAAGDDIVYLDERQIRDSWETEIRTVEKPWGFWVREVRVDPLYVNELGRE